VTNRLERECHDTAEALRRNASAFDAVLCRPEGKGRTREDAALPGHRGVGRTPVSATPSRSGARRRQHHRLPDGTQAMRGQGEAAFRDFGAGRFMLPNLMYGSWQDW
jgi:hypothetical protein